MTSPILLPRLTPQAQLALWQLISPTLPVGGFNYSEGIEWLVETGTINDIHTLQDWLAHELDQGSIWVETAIMARAYRAVTPQTADTGIDHKTLHYWNQWLTATRETRELRQQSWQMGRSLRKLLLDLSPDTQFLFAFDSPSAPCHYAIAFGLGAAFWHIELHQATLGYLHSWVNNVISAGVRLVPLGQTEGQRLLFNLMPDLIRQTERILRLKDNELYSCSWGLSLASMGHETQYSRLFRS
jgi:urease accessory protein